MYFLTTADLSISARREYINPIQLKRMERQPASVRRLSNQHRAVLTSASAAQIHDRLAVLLGQGRITVSEVQKNYRKLTQMGRSNA